MFLHVGMEIVKLVFLGRFQNIEAKIFVLHFKIYLKITENFLLVGDRRRLKGATDADQNPFLQKCASHRLYNVYIYMYNCALCSHRLYNLYYIHVQLYSHRRAPP